MSPECPPYRPESRLAALDLLRNETVDGIVCFSDVVAFGVLDAVAELGLEVGSDVRVIGFDDVHDAGLNRPSLSSVAVPARETGRRAAEIVLQRTLGSTEPGHFRGIPRQASAARDLRLPPSHANPTLKDQSLMRTVPVLSAGEAAKLVSDNAVITVSSSSGLGCPDAVLEAVGARYAATGGPANLTSIHPIAAGDMYGIKGIDHLCRAGAARRVLAGSYPSGGSKLDPPLIRQLIHGDEIQALQHPVRGAVPDAPGGIDRAAGRAHRGRVSAPTPTRGSEGAKMNAVTDDFVAADEVGGSEYLFYPAVKVDVAIIRATTADAYGNLSYEQEGGTLGALDQAYAAHNNGGIVIAQVKRLVRRPAADPGRARARRPRRCGRRRARPDADHPDVLRSGAVR